MESASDHARPWGLERTLGSGPGVRIRLVAINPGQALPLQCHRKRVELWTGLSGGGTFYFGVARGRFERHPILMQDSFLVKMGEWHQAIVPAAAPRPLVLLQVWYGEELNDDDVELAPPGFMAA